MSAQSEENTVFEFLLEQLKNGVDEFESKNEYLEKLKNDLRGDSQRILLYNIYSSTYCKLKANKKYELFQEMKDQKYNYTLDQIEMIYCLNKCQNHIDQLIATIHYKWYHSSIFNSDSPFCKVCSILCQLEKLGYSVSVCTNETYSSEHDHSPNDKIIKIITQNGKFCGIKVYEMKKSLEKRVTTIFSKYFEAKKEIIYCNDKFTCIILFGPDWCFQKMHQINFLNALINRWYSGIEDHSGIFGLIKYHLTSKNSINATGFSPQFISEVKETKFYEESNVYGKNYQPIIKIPEMNLDKVIQWSPDTKESYSWLLHVAHFSYIVHLLKIDTENVENILARICKFECNFHNRNEVYDKAVHEYYDNMIYTPEFLCKDNVYREIFSKQFYSESFLRNFKYILENYPSDMPIVVPEPNFHYFSMNIYKYFKFNYRIPCGYLCQTINFRSLFEVLLESQSIDDDDRQKCLNLLRNFSQGTQINSSPQFDIQKVIDALSKLGISKDKIFQIYDLINKNGADFGIANIFMSIVMSPNACKDASNYFTFISSSPKISATAKKYLSGIPIFEFGQLKSIIDNYETIDSLKIFNKIEFIVKTAEENKLLDYANKFVDNYILSKSMLLAIDPMDEFLEYISENILSPRNEQSIKNKCNEIVINRTKSERKSLSRKFAEYILDAIKSVASNSEIFSNQLLKIQLFKLIYTTKRHLDYGNAKIKKYFVIYTETQNQSEIYFTQSENEIKHQLPYQIIKAYIDFNIPSNLHAEKFDIDALTTISRKLIGCNPPEFDDDVFYFNIGGIMNCFDMTYDTNIDFVRNIITKGKSVQGFLKQLDLYENVTQVRKAIKSFVLMKEVKSCVDDSIDTHYSFEKSYFTIDEIDSQIVSNFSKIEIIIPELFSIDSHPLCVKIYTTIQNPSISLDVNIDSIIFMVKNHVMLQFPLNSLNLGVNIIEGVLSFETLEIPIKININKVDYSPESQMRHNVLEYGEGIFDSSKIDKIDLESIKSMECIDEVISFAFDMCKRFPYLIGYDNSMAEKVYNYLSSFIVLLKDNYEFCEHLKLVKFLNMFGLISLHTVTNPEKSHQGNFVEYPHEKRNIHFSEYIDGYQNYIRLPQKSNGRITSNDANKNEDCHQEEELNDETTNEDCHQEEELNRAFGNENEHQKEVEVDSSSSGIMQLNIGQTCLNTERFDCNQAQQQFQYGFQQINGGNAVQMPMMDLTGSYLYIPIQNLHQQQAFPSTLNQQLDINSSFSLYPMNSILLASQQNLSIAQNASVQQPNIVLGQNSYQNVQNNVFTSMNQFTQQNQLMAQGYATHQLPNVPFGQNVNQNVQNNITPEMNQFNQ